MTSFSNPSSTGVDAGINGTGGRGASPGLLLSRIGLGLCTLLLPVLTAAAPLGPPISTPDPDTVIFELDEAAVPASFGTAAESPDADMQMSAEALALRIRGHIEKSRATGSPRPLGLAQGLLAKTPEARWTPTLYLMRATIRQRLHRFDDARADLDRVLAEEPGNSQAWLTLYSIALVQGDLELAAKACDNFGQLEPGLWAASCTYDVASYGDKPLEAFEALEARMANARQASPAALDWALVTLADMAMRLELPSAGRYWAISLKQNPGGLYRRARYADWLLGQDQPRKALDLTDGYEAVDRLAVLRAIAMTRLDHPGREALVANLDTRFEEARWRGELLHQWEFARYLLDVKGEARAALEVAQANWEENRSHPDRQLLIRAARAASDSETLEALGVTATMDSTSHDGHGGVRDREGVQT